MTELLAPAGSFDALKAAIANGANAVYLGGKSFSARAFADNFADEELREAVRLAHFHGVRVHVALNTLAADNELPGLLSYAAELYSMGVDAVIVQDLGVLSLLRECLPQLVLHASTQMSIHNASGCRLLKEAGISRVILARELSLSDLRAIRAESPLELEVFVHGALCICYSGQCLFSSLVGGRSGNRGKCAQPCRLAYQLTDAAGREVAALPGRYLLSPRDLFGFTDVAALHQIGLASWKIEGRMKKPEYVATVCRIYSQRLRELAAGQAASADEEALRDLMQAFNRDRSSAHWHGNPGASLMSWTRPNNRGLFLGRIEAVSAGRISLRLQQPLSLGDGVEVWRSGPREGYRIADLRRDGAAVQQATIGDRVSFAAVNQPGLVLGRPGDRVFKTLDSVLQSQAQLSFQKLPTKALDFIVTAQLGQALTIAALDADGYRALRSADYLITAANKPVQLLPLLQAQLGRLGGSGYALGEIRGDFSNDILLPASVLNQLRRELVEDLLRQRAQKDQKPYDKARLAKKITSLAAQSKKIAKRGFQLPACTVLAADAETAHAAARRGFRDIYLDTCGFRGKEKLDLLKLALALAERGVQVSPYLPQVILPREEAFWLRQIQRWQECPAIQSVVVHNLGHLRLLQEAGWQGVFYGGSGLNVYNSAACAWLKVQGLRRIALSPELTLAQLAQIDSAGMESEVFGQGALQLMVSEYCLPGAALGSRDVGKACSQPCRSSQPLYLTDEKGYTFPLREDAACRMHVFNSREHCLLEEMPALADAGVDRLLLDLRLYDLARAKSLLDLYQLTQGGEAAFLDAKEKLASQIKDYTKGHLYRGV